MFWAEIAKELWTMLRDRRMRKIADEQIDVSVVVQITETRTDCVSAHRIFYAAGVVNHGTRISNCVFSFGEINEIVFAIVLPQKVWLQSIIRNENFGLAVVIVVGTGYSSS